MLSGCPICEVAAVMGIFGVGFAAFGGICSLAGWQKEEKYDSLNEALEWSDGMGWISDLDLVVPASFAVNKSHLLISLACIN